MIRLVAMREALELNNIAASEMSMLCIGNAKFINMSRVLPWCLCCTDRRELVQAQLLSGIQPRYINERNPYEQYSQMQFSRIRRFECVPEGWICKKDNVVYTYDEYVQIAKNFWYQILEPLQLPDYYPDMYNMPDIVKLFIVNHKARESLLPLIYRDSPDVLEFLQAVQSIPRMRIGDLRYNMSDDDKLVHSRKFMKMLGATNPTFKQYTAVTAWKGYDDIFSKYNTQLNKVYALIVKCNCQGIINTALMEGRYEDFYRELTDVSDAGAMEQSESF